MRPKAGLTRVAIMQPYFLPYVGYWQLMHNVDYFVVYDNIKYTKKGWINRNRYLLNGEPKDFSIPLKKDSDYLDIRERWLSEGATEEISKLMRKLQSAYRDAPGFEQGRFLLEQVLACEDRNLFGFLMHSLERVHACLGLSTRLVVSSSLGVSRELKGQDRVIATCEALGGSEYLNPIGGVELYDPDAFRSRGIRLLFQRVALFKYKQFAHEFVPNLSILDALMFLGTDGVREHLPKMTQFETGMT
jgi:hypothetical protein